MARGPFQGTFQPNVRPTVATAPDAMVYINGELSVIGCPSCTKTFDLNKYITSIQVDLNVESPPGSASINLSVPRHIVDDFFFDGNPVISPMMEVEIFAKGYYLLEGLPQYYPIFWGLVTEVNESYSGGEHSVTIQCADILKWWDICKIATNIALDGPKTQFGQSLYGNVFTGSNPYDLIWSLALQSWGDVIVGSDSISNVIKEREQPSTFNAAMSDIMLYWTKRFSRIRSNLLLYGVTGSTVRGDTLLQYHSSGRGRHAGTFASDAIKSANGGEDGGQMGYDPSGEKVVAFRTNLSNLSVPDLWQSEYQTKLELARAAAESIGFEFFMDVSGDIVFKPPFYNLDVLGNKPVSWIQDIDIIDWDFGESESEVFTQLLLQGSMFGNEEIGQAGELDNRAQVVDYHLLRKYGWRSQDYNSEYIGDPTLLYYHGMDVLDRINAKRHRGTVTIPMRPELRLGFPVYVSSKDQVWYTQGISHNITFGGRAQTSLTLTAKRSKFIAPRGTGTLKLSPGITDRSVSSRVLSDKGKFTLDVSNAGSIPADPSTFEESLGADSPYAPLVLRHPKTGRIVGYPNAVMVYSRPFAPTTLEETQKSLGQKAGGQNAAVSKSRQKRQQANTERDAGAATRFTSTAEDAFRDKFLSNRYQYGLNSSGAFIYAHDASLNGAGVISEVVMLPQKNVTVTPSTVKRKFQSTLIRPVSDERGFEVIGHYRYGRRVALRDGRLIQMDADQKKAQVEVQFALSGDVFSTLTAQSQGLTAITSAYADPASAVTELQPEDLQSAGVINPETKEVVFTDLGDTVINSSPLGGVEQAGTGITAEATQLSRALTLAEMNVKIPGQAETDCPCVVGRADLAFMSTGYQVKTLNTSAADTSLITDVNASEQLAILIGQGLNEGLSPEDAREQALAQQSELALDTSVPIQVGREQTLVSSIATADLRIQQLDNEIAVAEQQVDAVKAGDGKNKELAKARQAVTDMENRRAAVVDLRDGLQAELDALRRSRLDGGGGVLPTGSQSELIGRVDTFLTNLYKALDKPHQEYESALRGDLIPSGKGDNAAEVRFGTNENESEFAPPFNAPNRFALGEGGVAGALADVRSNADNLSKAWSDFGTNLKNESKRTELTARLNNTESELVRLNKRLDQLNQQKNSNAVIIGIDIDAEIERVETRIGELGQEAANSRLQLQQI